MPGPLDDVGDHPRRIRPARQALARRPRSVADCFPQARVIHEAAQRLLERTRVTRRHFERSPVRDCFRRRATRRRHDRQAARQCLRQHHAITLVVRCKHENVGAVIERVQFRARFRPRNLDAPVETALLDLSAQRLERRRTTIERAHDLQVPVRRMLRRVDLECPDEHVIALARHD
jgi:hypothetical protein